MNTKVRKSNGQGHTYKVGNSYRTVIRHKGVVITSMAKTKPEAQRLAKLKVIEHSTHNLLAKPHAMSFKDYFDEWLENSHRPLISYSTYERYRGVANLHLLPVLGDIQMSRITKADISRLFTSLAKKGLSQSSLRLIRALLSSVFKEAKHLDLIFESPIEGYKVPKGEKRPIQPLSADEVRELLLAHSGTLMEARLHLALLYGLRQGEALGLRWSDIDLESRTLKVDLQLRRVAGELRFIELKTAASRRVIHLAAQTVQVLKVHKELLRLAQIQMSDRWEESGLVFPNKKGKAQQSKWDYELWKKALQRVGLEHRSLHNARHTAGTLMYSNGVGIETIRRILGHASVAMTSSTYVHTAEEPLRKAALAMDELFSSNCAN